MISQMRKVRNMLNGVSANVYHYWMETVLPDEYIIWQETGGGSTLFTDDQICESAYQFDVELYTKVEYSDTLENLIQTFCYECVSFTFTGTEYEVNTGYIHYSFQIEVS